MRALALLLGTTCALASAAQCNNPVFSDPAAWGSSGSIDLRFQLAHVPLPYPAGVEACKAYIGQDVCCSDATLRAIIRAYNTTHMVIGQMQRALAHVRVGDIVLQVVEGICKNTQLCPQAVTDVVDKYKALFNDAYQQLATSNANCYKGMTSYMFGMMCFSCSVDFQQYINNATKMVILAEDTCEDIYEDCAPMFSSVHSIMQLAVDFSADIATAFGHPFGPFPHVPDMCEGTAEQPGNCKDMLCKRAIHGFDVPSIAWNVPSFSALQAPRPSPQSTQQEVAQWVQKQLASTIEDLANTVGPGQGTQKLAATGVSHVQYSSTGGYKPYAVGCSDVNCPPRTPSSNNPTSSPWVWIGVVGGLLALAALAVTMFRRNRTARAGERQSLLR